MENRIVAVIILTIVCGAAYFIWRTVSRFLQIYQLAQDGIETNGRIIRQYKHWLKMPQSSGYYLDYTYIDRTGISHECKSMVHYDLWKAHPDGSPIAVTYSKSKPEISLPRILMEQARAAMTNRKG
jgi:hypothetical protein